MGKANAEELEIEVGGMIFNGYKVDVGNPHFVHFVDELNIESLEKHGAIIENSKYFPNKTNVEFVKVLNKSLISMLVWERGVRKNFGMWNWCLCCQCCF